MVDDKHKSEDFIYLFRLVSVLNAFEKRDEDIELPIIIKTIFFLIDLINSYYIGWLEGTKTIFHQSKKFLFHLFRKVFITNLVIP